MRVSREPNDFKPLVIILESQGEVLAIERALWLTNTEPSLSYLRKNLHENGFPVDRSIEIAQSLFNELYETRFPRK